MDFSIVHEDKKPILHRKDVKARIAYEESTPSRKEIRKLSAEKLNSKEALVLVTKIVPEVGSPSANIELRVYEDEASMKAIEHNYQLVRHGLADKKQKKAAAPADN
jgi:small subunit ribosomal protein S24e